MAEEPSSAAGKPLILELELGSGSSTLRQEILVSEGRPFRVVTRSDKGRWVIEGEVERIVDGIAYVHLKVNVYGKGGFSVTGGSRPRILKIDEFKGGGGGTTYLSINNLWIRHGVDAIPILIKQLFAEPDRSAAAARYLGKLGAEAELAITALKKVLDKNNEAKNDAKRALDRIEEAIRENGE